MELETIENKNKPSCSQIKENEEKKEEEPECAVCLQTCIHPVKLPCSHIFCFLCVKGVANQSKRCAMCRQEIPTDFLDNPVLLKKFEESEREKEGYQWFYGGRNGWWQYDERTSLDLETAFSRGVRTLEILVAGFLYSIDFDRMIQQRRNDPSRRRRIKRDLATIPKKGVAGLKNDASEGPCDESADVSEGATIPSLASLATSQIPSTLEREQMDDPPPLSEDVAQTGGPDVVVVSSQRPNRLTRTRRRFRSRSNSHAMSRLALDQNSNQSRSQVDQRDIVNRIHQLTGSLVGLSISAENQTDQSEEYLLPADDDAL